MAKLVNSTTCESGASEQGVTVELLTSPGELPARVAIALPKQPPLSNYIPMESRVLVAKLARKFNETEMKSILTLNRRIGLRCALRLKDTFSNADYLYQVFDPDSDSISEEAYMPSRTPENLEALKGDLETMLEMAGFQPVPQELIEIASQATSLRGFSIQHPPPEALRLKLYYQRLLPTTVTRAHWLFSWRKENVQAVQYSTLLACFQLMPVPPKPTWFQRLKASCWPCGGGGGGGAAEAVASEAPLLDGPAAREPEPPVHLRVFRSVVLHNADMLVPGAVARFTTLDKVLIWLPIAIGVCSALYKISTSSLEFTPEGDPVGFATTLALVLMPLSYALQARVSLQRKADNYKADIDEMLLMRQRSSNAGALQWLLERATAQEQKEILLAYAFLWGGAAEPEPVAKAVAKTDVDAAIERFLMNDILMAAHAGEEMAAIDFDMEDALGDVVDEGLVQAVGDGDMLRAVPLREAVDVMSIRNYPEAAADDRAASMARKWLISSRRSRALRAKRAQRVQQCADSLPLPPAPDAA
eukprot:jgi/Ulvmu1/11722/UM008_0133.1